MAARTLGLILSLWLFVSAFAWPRPSASFANACLVGLAAGVAALAGMARPAGRLVAAALSAWLLASAFVLPRRSGAAFWNDAAVALLMLAVSLVPGTMYPPQAHRRAHA